MNEKQAEWRIGSNERQQDDKVEKKFPDRTTKQKRLRKNEEGLRELQDNMECKKNIYIQEY